MPGAHMPHFQPMALAKPPATSGAAKPPRLWAMFHMPQYVPRSLPANQVVRMRAQQGPPTPCGSLGRGAGRGRLRGGGSKAGVCVGGKPLGVDMDALGGGSVRAGPNGSPCRA